MSFKLCSTSELLSSSSSVGLNDSVSPLCVYSNFVDLQDHSYNIFTFGPLDEYRLIDPSLGDLTSDLLSVVLINSSSC